jgi:chromosome segregation ATPase
LLQAGRTNAEKARDDAKSSLTKEQTAHQQTKKDKATAEQERDKLKKEHATCTTTIQALEKEKEALQKQLNELNAIITGVPQSQVGSEAQARVQQASLPLPPK